MTSLEALRMEIKKLQKEKTKLLRFIQKFRMSHDMELSSNRGPDGHCCCPLCLDWKKYQLENKS